MTMMPSANRLARIANFSARRWLLAGAASLTLASAVGANPASAQEIRIGGTGASLGTMQILAAAYAKKQPQAKVTVLPSMGSGGGIKGLLAGALDLALSARPLNDNEIKAGAQAVEYGRTPLVFATPVSTKATGLSTQQLVDAYSGKTEEWPDGSKMRIVVRPVGDTDTEAIKNLSAEMREAQSAAEKRKGLVMAVSDQETAAALEKIPGALGPSTLALLLSEKRNLKALSLNGVAPTPQNLANGNYPLAKSLLLVSGPKTSDAARDFLAFVQSAQAREVLAQNGHWVK